MFSPDFAKAPDRGFFWSNAAGASLSLCADPPAACGPSQHTLDVSGCGQYQGLVKC